MTRRMSFSQALRLLEARGITVEHLGRVQRYGCLMWRVDGQELDKEGVIRYAEGLQSKETVV
jgi:hypothetical protein